MTVFLLPLFAVLILRLSVCANTFGWAVAAMPELIAQTNMDTQAVNRLKEELTKMVNWLTKNANRYFTAEYEAADSEYIEKARGV